MPWPARACTCSGAGEDAAHQRRSHAPRDPQRGSAPAPGWPERTWAQGGKVTRGRPQRPRQDGRPHLKVVGVEECQRRAPKEPWQRARCHGVKRRVDTCKVGGMRARLTARAPKPVGVVAPCLVRHTNYFKLGQPNEIVEEVVSRLLAGESPAPGSVRGWSGQIRAASVHAPCRRIRPRRRRGAKMSQSKAQWPPYRGGECAMAGQSGAGSVCEGESAWHLALQRIHELVVLIQRFCEAKGLARGARALVQVAEAGGEGACRQRCRYRCGRAPPRRPRTVFRGRSLDSLPTGATRTCGSRIAPAGTTGGGRPGGRQAPLQARRPRPTFSDWSRASS